MREYGCVEAITPPEVQAGVNESPDHIHMKRVVLRGLAHFYPETEVRFPGIRRRADIVVRHPDIDRPVVIECQHSRMQLKEYEAREADYRTCSYLLWVFERRAIDPFNTIEEGYERELGGSPSISKVAFAEFRKQGFIHILDGDELQLVRAEEIERVLYRRWDDTFERRKYVRVNGVYPLFVPFDLVLRAEQYPRLYSSTERRPRR